MLDTKNSANNLLPIPSEYITAIVDTNEIVPRSWVVVVLELRSQPLDTLGFVSMSLVPVD